jgi:hypothetical protein
MEWCGGLKQLEDDHGKAVHINLQVVRLMPDTSSRSSKTAAAG